VNDFTNDRPPLSVTVTVTVMLDATSKSMLARTTRLVPDRLNRPPPLLVREYEKDAPASGSEADRTPTTVLMAEFSVTLREYEPLRKASVGGSFLTGPPEANDKCAHTKCTR
jgi:hypothetical protein